ETFRPRELFPNVANIKPGFNNEGLDKLGVSREIRQVIKGLISIGRVGICAAGRLDLLICISPEPCNPAAVSLPLPAPFTQSGTIIDKDGKQQVITPAICKCNQPNGVEVINALK
ncbi:MAG: hypothetical protein FWE92_01365, partial [Defluviitaleaceae bacterium]|nr:hypothetical protein [Defluviitaleaceae bacterium]